MNAFDLRRKMERRTKLEQMNANKHGKIHCGHQPNACIHCKRRSPISSPSIWRVQANSAIPNMYPLTKSRIHPFIYLPPLPPRIGFVWPLDLTKNKGINDSSSQPANRGSQSSIRIIYSIHLARKWAFDRVEIRNGEKGGGGCWLL